MDEKEKMLERFLKEFGDLAFVQSINSVTDEVEEYPPAIQDLEAIIQIQGEWDREDLKEYLWSILK